MHKSTRARTATRRTLMTSTIVLAAASAASVPLVAAHGATADCDPSPELMALLAERRGAVDAFERANAAEDDARTLQLRSDGRSSAVDVDVLTAELRVRRDALVATERRLIAWRSVGSADLAAKLRLARLELQETDGDCTPFIEQLLASAEQDAQALAAARAKMAAG
jgi:hypothetical protein